MHFEVIIRLILVIINLPKMEFTVFGKNLSKKRLLIRVQFFLVSRLIGPTYSTYVRYSTSFAISYAKSSSSRCCLCWSLNSAVLVLSKYL